MKLEVEQSDMEREEEVIVCCHDVEADWVGNVKDAAMIKSPLCITLRGTRPRCPSLGTPGSGPCPKAYSFTRMLPL